MDLGLLAPLVALGAAVPPDAPFATPRVLLATTVEAPAGSADIGANLLLADGGAIVAGWTTGSAEDARADGLVMRITPRGGVVWRRVLGGPGTDLLWTPHPDRDGGYTVIGFGDAGAGNGSDGWLVRLSAGGDVVSQRHFGGPAEERLTAMKPLDGGGWIAVGHTASRGAGGNDGWVVRLDASGAETAAHTVGTPLNDRAFGIEPLPGGGCLVAGSTGPDRDNTDPFIARLGPDGATVWMKSFAGPRFGVAHDMHARPDGGFITVGYEWAGEGRSADSFAIRFDADGRDFRKTSWGGPSSDRAIHSHDLAGRGTLVIGHAQPGDAPDENTGLDLFLTILGSDGEARWTGRFGGEGVEYGRGIAGTPGDLWLIGHSVDPPGVHDSRVLLVRMDARVVVGL